MIFGQMKSLLKFLHAGICATTIFSVTLTPFLGFSIAAAEENEARETTEEAIELAAEEGVTDIIVQFKGEEQVDEVLEENDLTQTDALDETGELVLVETEDGSSLAETIEELENNPNVEFAEPNYKREMSVISTDDTYKDLLWAIYNSGQTVNGTAGVADVDMDIDEAWNLTTGTSSIIVAVIDSGVDYNHPDLSDSMWDGTNCVDDQGNALGSCVHGYDYENNDKNPMPSYYHGTHVAGTIAAARNNGAGVIGVAPETKIMAIRFASNVATEIKAINFARLNGAKIINASFSGTSASFGELSTLQAFQDAGGIIVAAASNNNGNNNDTTPYYPASYPLDNIISVAATDQSDGLASFSNIGASSVDVGAPGVNIYSTTLSSGYAYSNGTSMSAPHVVGLVSLIWSLYPDLTPAEVKALVLNTGDPVSSLSGKTVSGNRVNAYNALTPYTPRIGYAADNIISSNGISHSTDASGVVTLDFYVRTGFSGISATTTEIEYSLDGGSSWATSSLGSEFDFNADGFETSTSFSGTPYELTWDTQQSSSTSATSTDQAMIRFKTSTAATSSPYAYSAAFDIDNIAPALDVDDVAATSTEEDSITITGTSEEGAVIDIYRNDALLTQYTIPSGTSTLSTSVALVSGTTSVFALSAIDEWGNRSATTTLSTVTHVEVEEEPVVDSGGGGGGGGGGSNDDDDEDEERTTSGGGGSAAPVKAAAALTPASLPSASPTALVAPGPSVSFARNLTIGSTGNDVTALQTFLESKGFLLMPPGVAKGYFGPATQSALIKFQIANGIAPASGYFGPLTRSFFASAQPQSPTISPASVAVPTTTASPSGFYRDLQVGAVGPDVLSLQQFLNSKGFTVSFLGAGSPGLETSTFGPATRAALIRFQATNGIVPASGYFGPITRGKISQ